jgi:hypothetical protein
VVECFMVTQARSCELLYTTSFPVTWDCSPTNPCLLPDTSSRWLGGLWYRLQRDIVLAQLTGGSHAKVPIIRNKECCMLGTKQGHVISSLLQLRTSLHTLHRE